MFKVYIAHKFYICAYYMHLYNVHAFWYSYDYKYKNLNTSTLEKNWWIHFFPLNGIINYLYL